MVEQNRAEKPAADSLVRVAVIGGGISGLAAVHRLIELSAAASVPVAVDLFETSSRLGGVIETERIEECLVEHGADSFVTDKPWGVDLCRRLGLEGSLISTNPRHRRALVLHKGKPVPVPDGFTLMAPSRIWPIVATRILSPLGKLRMVCECLVPRRSASTDESVGSFVRRRFGQEALDRLVQPLVGGIYTSDPEKLSLHATLPRFVTMERVHRSLTLGARRAAKESIESKNGAGESGARYSLFASLRNGMSELVDALAQKIRQSGELRLRTRVTSITQARGIGEGLSIAFSNGDSSADSSPYHSVLVALPADRAAQLVEPLDGALAKSLGEIEYASSAIVITGHSLADVANPQLFAASGLVVPAGEKRAILSVSFANRKFEGRAPEDMLILRTFVGGALDPEMIGRSDEALIRVVLSELRDIFGVGSAPRFARIARHANAMPQYHVGHGDRVHEIERRLSAHPRLALAGNAYHGVGLPDCIHSGEQAAERVFESIQ